jgi:hypothetical protein
VCYSYIDNDSLRLSFIKVCLPGDEGDDKMIDEFADQLEIMDSILSSNLDSLYTTNIPMIIVTLLMPVNQKIWLCCHVNFCFQNNI